MTKGIFGKWAASTILTLVLFVVSVLFSGTVLVNTASAQDVTADSANWVLKPLEVKIKRSSKYSVESVYLPEAAPVHNVRYVSAVLFANDANKNVFNPDNAYGPRDGAVDTDFGAGLLMRDFVPFFSNNEGGVTRQGPIIANIESSDVNDSGKPNEQLHLVAVIQNVDTAIVNLIKNEAAGGTTAQSIISKITAEFSKQLFTESDENPFASVHPNSVTGVIQSGSDSSSIGLTQSYEDAISGATMLLLHWDPAVNTALVASASLRTRAGQGASSDSADGAYNATITINGAKLSPSNLIGIEVNGFDDIVNAKAWARASGPDVKYLGSTSPAKSDMAITKLYDTVSRIYNDGTISELDYGQLEPSYTGTEVAYVTQFTPYTEPNVIKAGIIELTTPSGVFNSGNPVQYRASDVIVIETKFDINADLDGEPDAYFGGDSDPIAFGEFNASHLARAKAKNSSLDNFELTKNNRYGVLNSDGIIENASSKITVTAKSQVDSEKVSVLSFTNVSVEAHGYGDGAGAGKIITATFPISNSLLTSTQYEKFTFTMTVADDIGYATTSTNGEDTSARTFYVDTIGPEITQLVLEAEGRNSSIGTGDTGYVSQRRFSRNTGYNAMLVQIGVSGNGESTSSSDFNKWVHIAIDPDSGKNLQWNSQGDTKVSFDSLSGPDTSLSGNINKTGEYATDFPGIVEGASTANAVPGIAADIVIGVSATARFFHTSTADINSNTAQVIVSVSDDARNPAIGWVTDLENADFNTVDPQEAIIAAASRSYGVKTINGATKVPSVNISSASTNISVLNNGLSGTAVYKTINPSTLAIDNNPPVVLSATLTVTGMPSGYWNDISSSADIQARFNKVFSTSETLSFSPNATYVTQEGTKAFQNAPDYIKHYFRATAKVNNVTAATNFQTQNGSPLRLIVKFDPNGTMINGDYPIDMDAWGWHKSDGGVSLDLDAFKSYFNSNFVVSVSSAFIGFSTDSSTTLPGGWTIVGASIGGFPSNSDGGAVQSDIAFVTLETSSGITNSQWNLLDASQSISGASIQVFISDRVGNYNYQGGVGKNQNGSSIDFGSLVNSSTIIVDVSPIQIGELGQKEGGLASDQIVDGTAIDGNGQPLNGGMVLLITNTNNVSFLQLVDKFTPGHANYDSGVYNNIPSASYGQFAHIGVFSGTGAQYLDPDDNVVDAAGWYYWAAEDGFINTRSPYQNDDGVNDNDISSDVQSGYMIIISTTFVEQDSDRTDPTIFESFANGNNEANGFAGAFPYFVSSASRSETFSDNFVNYGSEFKSVSADFSDFVVGAKAVLPQVSISIRDNGKVDDISNATFGSIIEATWFYLIGSDANVNTSLSGVRSVTVYARDLSGNITAKGIRVASANFTVPTVSIESLKIYNTNKGVNGLAIQGTGESAQAVSAATFNKNNATMTLVAKITNSPLTSTFPWIGADLTAVGADGESSSNSYGYTVSDSTNVDGLGDVAVSSIKAGSVVYATWTVGPFDTAIKNRTAKLTVTATGTSLTAGSVQTSNIDVDQEAPSFPSGGASTGANTIVEKDLSGNNSNTSFDTNGDGRFRPGQIFSITTTIDVASNETEGDGSNGNAMIFTANLSDFGLEENVSPSSTSEDTANNLVIANWQATISSSASTKPASVVISATDPAGNKSTKTSDIVFIQTARPSVVNTVLSASMNVGGASQTPLTLKEFITIGTTNNSGVISRPSDVVNNEESIFPRVFKSGDQLKIESNIIISDDAFTDIAVTADMSSIMNTAPTRQSHTVSNAPAAIVSLGATQVYPTAKTTGNNINAEWLFVLDDPKDSGSTPQNIIINATVGAGSAFSSVDNATLVVPVIIDAIAPEVTLDLQWYKDKKPISGADLFKASPNNATARVIAYATFTDADSLRGYIGSAIQLSASQAADSDNALDSATRSVMSLNASDFGSSGSILPGFWAISDRTGSLEDTSAVHLITSGSSLGDIQNTTGTVLTAWFGEVPSSLHNIDTNGNGKNDTGINRSSVPQITVTNTNKANAKMIVSVTDSAGNVGQANSEEFEADGTGPVVQKDPFRLQVVQGSKYWPAQYSSTGKLESSTRVGNGSQFNAFLTIYDEPDKSDKIIVYVTGNDFGASSIDITSLATQDITVPTTLTSGISWSFEATPSNASDVTLTATFSAGSNGVTYQGIDDNEQQQAFDGLYDFGYSNGTINSKNSYFVKGASIGIQLIDSEGNFIGQKSSTTLDYDKQGPIFNKDQNGKEEIALIAVSSMTDALSVDESTKATFDNREKVLNANTSQWIVLAGTVIVDGTNDDHLSSFTVGWADALEQDISRIVAGSQSQGHKLITTASYALPSARALRFVTSAIQIKSDASPSSAQDVKIALYDFFNNKTEHTVDKVAVNASGPNATEIRLYVNGVSQLQGTSLLGIGSSGPDSASSSFEIVPGDDVMVEAVINTVGTGRAPQFIYANLSSLYPPELLNNVDQIIPSATEITADGTVLAKWEYLTGDYRLITATNAIAFNDVQFTSGSVSAVAGDSETNYDTRYKNGIIAGVTIETATSLTLGNGPGFGALPGQGLTQTILNNITGLPKIQVQQNAKATMSASISIYIDEEPPLNLFGSTNSPSSMFAVDTQRPVASWYVPWELISRVQSPPLTGFVGYNKVTGQIDSTSSKSRVGFPTTPVLTALDILNDGAGDLNSIYNVPARVKGGDTVYIIANVTNENISKNGDDRFRPYPGDTFNSATLFTIDSSNVDVHADLSEFGGPSFADVSILGSTTGQDASPAFNVLTKNQNYSDKATQIAATYALTISSDLGVEVTTSRKARDATFTVIDDAGNKPYDTFDTIGTNQTLNQIKRLVRPGAIGVDNRAPTISGTLDVIELSPNTGTTLQNGSAIVGGSKLSITANINDSVDNPLDVLNNSNWGNVSLSAVGITLEADDVILLATSAQLSGNSVSVPFSVDIPAIETGISTAEFQFKISATDSIGNTTTRLSNDKFKFDARPDMKWADASATTIETQVTFHAGGPALVVSANAFDVGGVSEVVLSIDGSSAASQLPVLAESGITFDSTFVGTGGTGVENVNVPVTITSIPEIGVTPFTFIVADVTDISGATNTAQIVVNYNRPAIFAADFALTAVNSSGADIAPATVISGSGSLETEGDIREITITEGSTLTVTLAASDGDSDAIIYGATGTAFDTVFEDSVFDATTNVFTFKPGYTALTGEDTSKTFDAVFTANDGKHPTSDVSTIRITVTKESAVPVVDIQSITITNLRDSSVTSADATENDTINIPENTSVEMVVVATDAGGENLVFTTTPDTALVVATQISNSTGIATATVTFNLGFDDADIVISESAIDPTLLTFSAANSVNTGSVTKSINVTNSSQPGVITTTYTRNGGVAQSISDGSAVTAAAGDVIVFNVNVADPDQIDRFDFPVITFPTDNPAFAITSQFVGTNQTGTSVDNSITVVVASEITADTSATINYSAQKDTLDAIVSTATYFVNATSTPAPPVTQIDELVLAQGAGGTQLVNVRNFDSGSATPVNGIIDQFRSVGPLAIAAWGGGQGRGTYVNVGDADNDNDLDYVMTFGPINETATLPNIFVPRDLATKQVIGIAPHAFPAAGPIGYATGNLTSAIGDFMVDGTNQVAVAQGIGSSRSLVRIFEYTGLTGPGAWKVVAQFQPLDNVPNNNNANGGVSLDAADVDGDGLSELIVGQTASASSLTQFTIIDVDPTLNANGISNGAHVRHNFVAFAAGFRGGGGVDVTAADLNSDGVQELVFTSGPLNGSTELGSLVTVVRPVVANNVVTGYERPGNSIVQVVAGDSNPGGGLSIASGEFDGDATNGQELLIGSGNDAPQSFYRVVKVSYDGTDVTGTTFLIGPPNNFAFTQPAFLGNFNPTSGAVNVEAANHTVRN